MENMNNLCSLKYIWNSLGFTEFSFLFCLKIIFFLIFMFLNIWLYYTESLNRKQTDITNPDTHMQSSIVPQLKRIAQQTIVGIGFLSAAITVKNEIVDQAKKAALTSKGLAMMSKGQEDAKKITTEEVSSNFILKLNLVNIKNTHSEVLKAEKEESETMKMIAALKVKWEEDGDKTHIDKLKLYEGRLDGILLKKNRAQSEVEASIEKAKKYSEELANQTDENILSSLINGDDVNKSMIFDPEVLWSRFETFDGLTKTVCLMLFSNYIIITCILSLTINLYGDYLLERFQLEKTYPKVAIFIKYRRKISKYYILSNLIFILIVCLMNLLYSVSVLSLLYT